jgi:ABC-type transport system involved in cytochrome c biogenesis permease subunit
LLHQRLAIGWRGKKAATMAIIGFLAVLFTFLGVNLVLSGLHSYATWR